MIASGGTATIQTEAKQRATLRKGETLQKSKHTSN